MVGPNLHIEEFLEYYYSFEQEPGYAVLLKGKWGTGKTWFINQTLNSFAQKGGKYLYVSLYGITSFEEIEDEFFKQLHPLLSSKSMALTGKIAKGLLKATLKIDLDSDEKADGSLSAQAPDLNLPDYLTNTSGFVVVFDDLERASINLESLLGYINHYVEHQGYKVIIVANEEEILAHQEKQDDFKLAYRRIKEKLVGKTFEINPDLGGALVNFISEIKEDSAQELYNRNINLISEIYESSKYQNLRHLKQALWDFERFLSFVSADASSKDGLLDHLLKIFLILSFEMKSGSILPQDISNFKAAYLSGLLDRDSKNKEETPYQRVSKKYKNISLSDLLIEESIWIDFFDKGCCSEELVQESLEKSEYYRTENTPDWVRLWHSMDLSDDEFTSALESVEKDFYDMKYSKLGVIRHVAGIFLWLSKIDLIKKTRREILEFSCSYIDWLKENNNLNLEVSNRPRFRDYESWGGLGFHEKESGEFKELNKYIDKLSEQAVIEDYPTAGEELIQLISYDPDLFYRKVVLCNDSDNIYYEIPIFQYIDASTFVEAFVSAIPSSRNTICYAFSERYKFDNFNASLIPELDWLRDMIKLLEEKRQLFKGKISGYQLQSYINTYFRPAMEELEQFKAKNQSQPDS
ncbi:P-loop NTPase fold protein [Pseudoalteromonas sp. MMG022]|uniref:P-loop NTPase fold protein n=1 Tax=Pseudoalteromonas sp. MMG022 TaxID=2909978 RepID=UPI001F276ED2|nr:P-loop NTPase fold protein [Pseudoalteromonas sp. MMG022]MCF6437701.1 KAP family NTPase [Pseudoalteromonas sp. MMG022]